MAGAPLAPIHPTCAPQVGDVPGIVPEIYDELLVHWAKMA